MENSINDRIDMQPRPEASRRLFDDNSSTNGSLLNREADHSLQSQPLLHVPELTISSGNDHVAQEYQVKNGDSLWKISRSFLQQEGADCSGPAVQDFVRAIIEANKNTHPELAKNPKLIDSSMHLLIPDLHNLKQSKLPKSADEHPVPEPLHPHSSTAAAEQQPNKHTHHTVPTTAERNEHPSAERGNVKHDSKTSSANHDMHHIENGNVHTVASWYGSWFNGRKTSSGERYDINKMTAAHKTLPFGTMVEVTNPANGHHVVVKINDRGPFVQGRGLDLTPMAARKLGTLDCGVANVSYKVVSRD